MVGVIHRRLRVFARLFYFSTVNRNYCGVGNEVTCDPAVAEAAADTAGLAGDARADFVRHYYLVRFLVPGGQLSGRWRICEGGPTSVFASWRVQYYRSGGLGERGPFPGSLYAIDHPGGEEGFASVPQLGIMYDTRDREGTPSSGLWLEASARVTAGGAWTFGGVNATARAYHRLHDRVVSATRAVVDIGAGDPPLAELGLVNAADTYVAFGGELAGRGIREHRYVGRVKAIAQQELRIDVSRRWQTVAFLDLGWIGVSLDNVGGKAARVLGGGGAGARFVHSQTFILRADVGISPHEGWSPQIYLQLGHLF
jgi:hypothetical protein